MATTKPRLGIKAPKPKATRGVPTSDDPGDFFNFTDDPDTAAKPGPGAPRSVNEFYNFFDREPIGKAVAPIGKEVGRGHQLGPVDQGYEKTFADYLAEANALGLGGSGKDYSGMERYLRDNAASADSRLEAMYRQLRGSIDSDAAGIGANYDTAGAKMAGNAQSAQSVVNQGYDSARNAQTQQLAALGIGEAAGTLAANGGFAAGDQGAANANIEQNRLAGTQQSEANKASALNYNTGIGNAAGLEGNVQRALVQQQLAQALAELKMKQQEDSSSGARSAFETALQLKSMDDSAGSGQAKAAQQDFENQLAVAKLKLEEAKSSGSGRTLQDALTNYAQLQQIAQQAGVGSDADSYKAFLENLKLAGNF